MARSLLLIFICLILPLASLGDPLPQGVVATVSDVAITQEALRQATDRIRLRYGDRQPEEVLQTLIGRKIMVLEGEALGFDQHPLVLAAVEAASRVQLTESVYRREVSDKLLVPDADILSYYRQNQLDQKREIRGSHIELASSGMAQEVLGLLDAGDDFPGLAQRFSVDVSTANKGGDMGFWQEEDTLRSPFVRQLFTMEPGTVSAPYRDGRGHYHIIKAVEERPVGLEPQRQRIHRILAQQEKNRLWRVYREGLAEQAGLCVNDTTLAFLLQMGRRAVDLIPPIPPQDLGRILCTFEGGELDLGTYSRELSRVSRGKRPASVDSAAVAESARQMALTAEILPAFMLAQLPGEDSVASQREEAVAMALRRFEVEDQVLSQTRLQAYYDSHRGDFVDPKRTFVEGGIVASRQQGEAVAKRVNGGEELDSIMRSYPTLLGRWRKHDAFSFTAADTSHGAGPMGPMIEVARGMAAGEVRGPIPVSFGGGYVGFVVLKVLERRASRMLPFEEALPAVRSQAKGEHRKEIEVAFTRYIDTLRKKYAGQIVLD
jgi:peptidyl-prolyl cis-trans isomerase C